MSEQDMKQREAISAMADGQLSDLELAWTLDVLRSDRDAVAAWHCYHVVGDVMRGSASTDAGRDAAFLQRLRGGLEHEANAIRAFNPVLSRVDGRSEPVEPLDTVGERSSANDAHFSWRWVAGVAVTAIAVTVAWMAVPGTQQSGVTPILAKLPESVPSASPVSTAMMLAESSVGQQSMIRDPKLDQWLDAHRQFGGVSALQVPAGFVRNATFEGAAR